MTADTGVFAGVLGNEPSLRLLKRGLATDGVAHAYLFHGQPGVGKRTVARRFGAALVAGGDATAEDRARRGLHPDLVEIEPEGVFTTIKQIREVVRLAASRPFEGARRCFILFADTFNSQAANALLKTLEEPEGESVFLLLASSREGVLPTVVSRAQAIRFDPVPVPEVARFLEGHGVEEAELVAALGRGSVGLSLRYAREEEMRELRDVVFETGFSYSRDFEERHRAVGRILARAEAVGAAREKAYLEAFDEGGVATGASKTNATHPSKPDRRAKDGAKRAGRAARDGAVTEALELLALLYRDAAVIGAGAPELAANVDRVGEIQSRVAESPEADWAGAALTLGESRASLAYNVSPEAILEVALSRIRRRILGSYPGW